MLENQERVHLQDQLLSDINEYLAKFRDYSLGQKTLAKRAGVHSKTIQRICRRDSFPGHVTILKIYSIIFNENDYAKLYSLLPEVVRQALCEDKAQITSVSVNYSAEIRREILNDKVFCEIYFLADAGNISHDLIQFKFGEHGIETLKKMLSIKALQYNDRGELELGKHRVEIDPKIIKRAGLLLSQKYSKTLNCEVKGENFVALYVESLPEEAYNEWLAVDKEAFIKKAKIAQKYRDVESGRKVFTYMATDTFKKEEDEIFNH
jgi:transcriptional regulator with XRE-family HTH domain